MRESVKTLKRITAKKRLTGADVGQVLIASALYDIEQHRAGEDGEPQTLVTQEQFDAMFDTLRSDKDLDEYHVYKDIYNLILEVYNHSQAQNQQFNNGYFRLANCLQEAISADKALSESERFPLIMTESQYQRERAGAEERIRGEKYSFFRLFDNVLVYCCNRLETQRETEIPQSILQAIKATQAEPVTNQRILATYNADTDRGYYVLPDGQRSDRMNEREWQDAVKKAYLKTHVLHINGKPASEAETIRHYQTSLVMDCLKLLYDGEEAVMNAYRERTGQEYSGDIVSLMDKLEVFAERSKSEILWLSPSHNQETEGMFLDEAPAEWKLYADPPEGLTKYDVIKSGAWVRYSWLFAGDKTQKARLNEFKADYPILFSAITEYIKMTVPTAKTIKPSQYFTENITAGELMDSSFIGFKQSVTDFDIILHILLNKKLSYSESQRAQEKGIAIIQNPLPSQITSNGDYKEPPDPLGRFNNLDALAADKDKRYSIESFQEELIKPALRYIYGYNALLGILGDVYKIKGIEVARLGTGYKEKLLSGYSNTLYRFYFEVYGDADEKARKRGIIKDLFKPIDTESLKPAQEAIDRLTDVLKKAKLTEEARGLLRQVGRLIYWLADSAKDRGEADE